MYQASQASHHEPAASPLASVDPAKFGLSSLNRGVDQPLTILKHVSGYYVLIVTRHELWWF